MRANVGGTPPRGLASVPGARNVQRLEVALLRGFRSVGALVQSARRPARGLLIWHNSHNRVPNDVDLIGSVASAGYDVAVLSMRLYVDNRSRPVLDAAGIRIQPRTHGDLMRVARPLRFFLDPMAGVVNALAGRYGFIAMGGLSGGGRLDDNGLRGGRPAYRWALSRCRQHATRRPPRAPRRPGRRRAALSAPILARELSRPVRPGERPSTPARHLEPV